MRHSVFPAPSFVDSEALTVRILLARNRFTYEDRLVETYSGSMVRVLRERGHEVAEVPKGSRPNYDGIDLLIDVDSGRNEKGELIWMAGQEPGQKPPAKSAVMFIDSHGYPSLHKRLARNYDHVFFAVWDKRDLFAKHPSAHWCPNFTDLKWFDGMDYLKPDGGERFHFGFYGSKGGLERAKPLQSAGFELGFRVDARQVCPGGKHAWPSTARAMARCTTLFNCGQKHDGPNLRVMESMAMERPLITDLDQRDGMSKLFTAGTHYVPFVKREAMVYEGLKEAMLWVMDHPGQAAEIAADAYREVKFNHLVENRIDQILEVVNNG